MSVHQMEFTTPRTFTPFVPAVRNSSQPQQPHPSPSHQGAYHQLTPQPRSQGHPSPQYPPQQRDTVDPTANADAHPDVSSLQTQQKSTRICRHNQRGRCTWGEHCRFVHEPPAPVETPQRHQQQVYPQTVANTASWHTPNGEAHGPAASATDRTLMVGIQQSRLQTMRHAKLLAALKGTYETSPSDTPGHVTVTGAGLEPDTVAFLSESQMAAELRKFDDDQRFADGGSLMYLVGEPSVFYSAVRMFNTQGTCGHNRLDFSLHMAHQYDLVECMFSRSAAGCQALKCGYEHRNLYAAALDGSLGLQLPPGFRLLRNTPVPIAMKGIAPSSKMTLPPADATPPTASLYSTQPPGKFTASTASFTSGTGGGLSATSVPKMGGSLTGSQDDFVFLGDSPMLGSKKVPSVQDLSQWDTMDKVVQTLKTGSGGAAGSATSECGSSTWGSSTTALGVIGPVPTEDSKTNIW